MNHYPEATPVERTAAAIERMYERDDRFAEVERVAAVDVSRRIDESIAAGRCGNVAAELIRVRNNWLARSKGEGPFQVLTDSAEVKELYAEAVKALGPVISRAVTRQRWHQTNAQVKQEAA